MGREEMMAGSLNKLRIADSLEEQKFMVYNMELEMYLSGMTRNVFGYSRDMEYALSFETYSLASQIADKLQERVKDMHVIVFNGWEDEEWMDE